MYPEDEFEPPEYESVEVKAERHGQYVQLKEESDEAWENGNYDEFVSKQQEMRDL